MGKYLSSFRIFLPFAFDTREAKSSNTMTPFKELDESKMDVYWAANNIRGRAQKRKRYSHTIHFMLLGAERHDDKTRLFLEMTFPITFSPALVTKEDGFNYKWNKKRTTIRRFLGTKKPEMVMKQARKLLKECNRFYFMYHTPKEKKSKKKKTLFFNQP